MNPFSKKIEAFGLDFSNHSLKLAKLEPRLGSLALSCFGDWPLPAGLLEASEVVDEKQLAQQLKDFLNHHLTGKLKTRYVVCSLPEEKSFVDVLAMPLMQDKELESAILFELENHIPLSAAEVYFDFQKHDAPAGSKQQEVLIAATPKNIVDSYLRVLALAGLTPVALEVESLAIVRSLMKQATDTAPALIVDLGQKRSNSIIFAYHSLRFTSALPFSGQQLTEVIKEKMKVSFEVAEQLKQKEGLEGDVAVFRAMAPLIRELSSQIKSHLEYFSSQGSSAGKGSQTVKVERVVLTGDSCSLKGLANLLAQNLGLRVVLGNPWSNILNPPLKEVPLLAYEQSLGYAVALGLALRGVPQLATRLLF